MKRLLVLGIVAAGAMAGCVPSIHGIATKETTAWDENLVGTWQEPDEANDAVFWKFEKGNEKNPDCPYYILTIADDQGRVGKLRVWLVQLGDQCFMDMFPEKRENEGPDMYEIHFVPMHTFAIVDELKPGLRFRLMSPDKVKDLLKDQPQLVKHENVDNGVLLTAEAEELQGFVAAYAPVIFADKGDKDGCCMFKRQEK